MVRALLLLFVSIFVAYTPSASYSQPVIRVEPDSIDFGVVRVGESSTAFMKVINIGDDNFLLKTGSGGGDLEPIQFLETGGGLIDIPPGDTVEMMVTFTPLQKGFYRAYRSYTSLGNVTFAFSAKGTGLPTRTYFSPYIDVPRVEGCLQPTTHAATIVNPSGEASIIDSIVFGTFRDTGWTFISHPADATVIAPGDSISFVVARDKYAKDVELIGYFDGGRTDTIVLALERMTASPYIRIPTSDTVYLNLELDQSTTFQTDISNRGELFRITHWSVEGDQRWELLPIDTNRAIRNTSFIPVNMRFNGASSPGEYAVTFRVWGTPCDTVLTRTLIARVGLANVAQLSTSTISLEVLPDRLLLHGLEEFTYSISSITGSQVVQGRTTGGSIDIGSLSAGIYLLHVQGSEGDRLFKFIR
jgi:hypothetical protein